MKKKSKVSPCLHKTFAFIKFLKSFWFIIKSTCTLMDFRTFIEMLTAYFFIFVFIRIIYPHEFNLIYNLLTFNNVCWAVFTTMVSFYFKTRLFFTNLYRFFKPYIFIIFKSIFKIRFYSDFFFRQYNKWFKKK